MTTALQSVLTYEPQQSLLTKWNGFSIEAQRIAKAIEITCDEEEQMAVDSLSQIKNFQKETESARKSEVEPFNLLVKRVNGIFKPIGESLDSAEATIKEKIKLWRMEKEKIRVEMERKRLAEFQAKVEAEKAKRDQGVIVAPPPAILPAEQTTRGGIGAATASKFWNYRVTSLDELYKARPDLVKMEEKRREILSAISDGTKIPGLEIFEDMKVSAR